MTGTDSVQEQSQTLLSLEELLGAVKGTRVLGPDSLVFLSVATDSRVVGDKCLFVPLIGEKQDGHAYIPDALAAGASVVFVERKHYKEQKDLYSGLSAKYPMGVFIAVEDTLGALQHAAARYVEKFPRLIRIGITGSSGKTTTKEIAATILSERYRVVATEGNLNSETGLPLSVFKIRAEHEVGIFEMGVNREHEMDELAFVLKPQAAIVTNIGTAHIGKFGSRDAIAHEKAKIFSYFKGRGENVAVIPFDDDYAKLLAREAKGNVVYYGINAHDSTVRFVADRGLAGTEFSIAGQRALFPLPGMHNFKNALAAIVLAQSLGLSASEIIRGAQKVQPLFGRSQIVRGTYTIVQDCYNANPDSMQKAVAFASSVPDVKRRIFVLGDMLELGDEAEASHRAIGTCAAQSTASVVVFVGPLMKEAFLAAEKAGGTAKLYYVEEFDDSAMSKVAKIVKKAAKKGDLILLKASRGMALERIVPLLQGNSGGAK